MFNEMNAELPRSKRSVLSSIRFLPAVEVPPQSKIGIVANVIKNNNTSKIFDPDVNRLVQEHRRKKWLN